MSTRASVEVSYDLPASTSPSASRKSPVPNRPLIVVPPLLPPPLPTLALPALANSLRLRRLLEPLLVCHLGDPIQTGGRGGIHPCQEHRHHTSRREGRNAEEEEPTEGAGAWWWKSVEECGRGRKSVEEGGRGRHINRG